MASHEDAGRNCPYCRFAFKQGVSLAACPSCHAVHHEECWADNGGCAIVGCACAPARTGVMAAVAPPPAAAPSPAVPAAAAAPAAAPSRGGIWSPLALVALGALIAGGAAAGAYALTTEGGGGSSQRAAPLERAAATPVTEEPVPEEPTPAPTPSPAEDRGAVVATLHDYEAAYSTHDVSGLRRIFTPGVTRHGLRATGCSDTTGREAVLETYREQFSLGTGSYTLVGLSRGSVELSGPRARVPLNYSIGSGGTGSVEFRLRRDGERWRIARVIASC